MMKQYIRLFKDPMHFFKWEAEKNYLKIVLFFLAPFTILLLSEIILTIISGGVPTLNQAGFIVIFLVFVNLIAVAVMGVYSALTNIGAKFFNKKAQYYKSLKATSVGFTNILPYLFVLMIITFISLLITENTSSVVYLLFAYALPVIGYAHGLITQVIAMKIYHKLSVKQALISVILPLFIFVLLVLLTLMLIIYIQGFQTPSEFMVI